MLEDNAVFMSMEKGEEDVVSSKIPNMTRTSDVKVRQLSRVDLHVLVTIEAMAWVPVLIFSRKHMAMSLVRPRINSPSKTHTTT